MRTPRSAARPEALLHLRAGRCGRSRGRVLRPVAAEDQHGQLGQVVAGEDVERAALEHLPDRRPPVAVEARRVADPQGRASRPVVRRRRRALVTGRPGERLGEVQPAVGVRRRRPAAPGRPGAGARVTRRQKSRAGPVTRWAASSGPHVQTSPSGAVSSTWNALGRRGQPVLREGEVAGADAEVRHVPQPRGRPTAAGRARR